MQHRIFIYKFYYDWWKNIDKSIFFLILLLFSLGLFFSLVSTSLIASDKLNTNSYYFFFKHFFYIGIGFFLFAFFSILKEESLFKISLILFLVCLIFLLLVPFIGVEIKGSKRWLDFPILPAFQPVELVKPLFVIFVAKIIVLDEKKNIYNRYLYSFLFLIFISIFLINQPDIGQTLLISTSWITMIFISGFNMLILSILGLVILGAIIFLILLLPEKFGYVFLRIQSFIDPKNGDNFQSEKALEAIKQGGLTGQGMGEGILKDKVPEAHTDYIIAVISEEFGAIFVLFVIIIFLFITYKVINKVFFEPDDFLKLALVGLVSLLIIQTFIHIGVNIRLLPTTGMTLPFLSYGGSSLIGNSIIAGIILNFTRKDSIRYKNND